MLVALAFPISAEEFSCWVKNERELYREVKGTQIHSFHKCRAHCFDHASYTGQCSTFNLFKNGRCTRQINGPLIDVCDLVLSTNSTNYILKDECTWEGCWSRVEGGFKNLQKVTANGERDCKFACLEIEECMHASFDGEGCKVQRSSDLIEDCNMTTPTFKQSERCKRESCWKRYDFKSYKNLVKADGHNNWKCRNRCLEHKGCGVYTYTRTAHLRCQIQTELADFVEGDLVEEGELPVTYVLKESCREG